MADQPFDLAAAGLRADTSDARALAEALAAKLSSALPEQTNVRRRATKLLSREKRVQEVEVRLGDEIFSLSLAGTTAETIRAKAVHGVVIKREQLPLDRWLEALGQALTAEAGHSETARVALQRLLE